MNNLTLALRAEWLKVSNARMLWISALAFALAPVMGGIFIYMVQHPETLASAGALADKASAAQLTPDWPAYLNLLTQAVGVGGLLLFGFAASWIFGREYAEGTLKDLMALPVPRSSIVQAKFIVYACWCVVLVVSNLIVALLIGLAIGLPVYEIPQSARLLGPYAVTTVLTLALGAPVAFFALLGRGYLAPLGMVALTMVLAQIIAATGLGAWFPWAVPGLYSGTGGHYPMLGTASYALWGATCLTGYLAAIYYLDRADYQK